MQKIMQIVIFFFMSIPFHNVNDHIVDHTDYF